MKRLATLLIGALFAFCAQAQTTIAVEISYTTGAAALGVSVSSIAACVSATNNKFTSQGINVQIQPFSSAAGVTARSDSASMQSQFEWAQSSLVSLRGRKDTLASMAVVVSAPGAGVPGRLPTVPPLSAKDAAGAVNAANLCSDLEQVIARNLGATSTQGVAARYRTFPYQGGTSVCYHTTDTEPSDPNGVYPYQPQWTTGGLALNAAATLEQSCENYRTQQWAPINPTQYASSGVSHAANDAAWYCSVYDSANPKQLSISPRLMTYATPPGTSTIPCSTDAAVAAYSSPNLNPYNGNCSLDTCFYPLGDASHNNVAAMNARAATVLAFRNDNGKLLAAANASWWSYLKSFYD